MISNILLGVGIFLVGGLCGHIAGMLHMTHLVKKAGDLYKEETGNDFVSWILNKDKEDYRVTISYAAE